MIDVLQIDQTWGEDCPKVLLERVDSTLREQVFHTMALPGLTNVSEASASKIGASLFFKA